MIKWNKYADEYYVISYVKNFEKRKKLEKQFKKIGLNKFKYYFSVNSNLLKTLPVFKDITSKHFWILEKHLYCTLTHYFAIKEAYDLGYESIIIIEDDVNFLKDKKEIENQLDKYYLSGDIVLFDYIKKDDIQYVLSDFYRLNRNGMKYLIENIEDHLYIIDNYFSEKIDYMYFFTLNTQTFIEKLDYINVSSVYPKIRSCDKRICIQSEYDEKNKKYNIYSAYYNVYSVEEININENEYYLNL